MLVLQVFRTQAYRDVKVGERFCIKARESGLVLDVAEASKEDGGAVIQWGFHGKENQQWKLMAATRATDRGALLMRLRTPPA